MFRKILKRLINWAVYTSEGDESTVRQNPDWYSGVEEVSRIYRIGNGYLLQTETSDQRMLGGKQSLLQYCKDDKEIAEQIISANVHNRINPAPKQYEMTSLAQAQGTTASPTAIVTNTRSNP